MLFHNCSSETSGKDTARAKLLTRAMKQCMVRENAHFSNLRCCKACDPKL
uniref:Uncharacterized protein n=1 Tax=Anguilla anguilla TaxID=7936 RepID=A0A0E9QTP3_ANGAN